jgi:hypothetical protein
MSSSLAVGLLASSSLGIWPDRVSALPPLSGSGSAARVRTSPACRARMKFAHAVIARAFGIGVTSVVICPDLSGIAYYDAHASYLARNADSAALIAALETDAIIALAGPAAECLYWRPTKRDMAALGRRPRIGNGLRGARGNAPA